MARLLNCGFEVQSFDIFDYMPGNQSADFYNQDYTAHDQSGSCYHLGYYTVGWDLGVTHTEQYGGFRWYGSGWGGGGQNSGLLWYAEDFTKQGELYIQQNATRWFFSAGGGVNYLASKSTTTNKWYWLEWHYKVDASAGIFELKIDGELLISVSGIDSKESATGTGIRWLLLPGVGTGSYNTRYDDIVVNDTSGSGPLVNRSWPGEVVVTLAELTDDVSATQEWAGSGMTGTPGAYATEVAADSPKLFLRFNDTSGTTANDDSAGNHDGTIGSTVTLNQPGITGDGPAFAFVNDTNSYVEVADHSDLNPTAALSVEVWAKGFWDFNLDGSHRVLVQKHGQYSLRYDPPNFYWSVWVGGTRYDLTSDNVEEQPAEPEELNIATDGGWHHIVATFDDTTDLQEVWLDGLKIGSRTQAGPLSTTTNVLRVGRGAGGSTYINNFFGYMDDVAVYSTALSQTRIQTHHKAGKKFYELLDDTYFFTAQGRAQLTGNADLEYIQTTTTNKKALYEAEDLDARFSLAQSITVWVGARKAEPTSASIQVLLKRAGVEATGPTMTLLGVNKVHRATFDRDTTDTSDWGPAKVNNLQVGVKSV